MSFDTHMVPVTTDGGYNYQLRNNGMMVGKAILAAGDWVATPYENGKPNRDKTMTFKRLGAAEYYLLAIVYDGTDYL